MRTTIDFNQPLVKDRLAVRLAAVKDDKDSWRAHERDNQQRLFLTSTWQLARDTQLVVEGEIVRTEGKWTKMTIRRYHFRTRGLGKSIRPLPWPEAKPQPLVACAVAS